MVRVQGGSEYEKLDQIMREVVPAHGFRLDVVGWTRKTYDVYEHLPHKESGRVVLRVESFVTTNGEIVVFDDSAMKLAEELGGKIEEAFDIAEAVVVRKPAQN